MLSTAQFISRLTPISPLHPLVENSVKQWTTYELAEMKVTFLEQIKLEEKRIADGLPSSLMFQYPNSPKPDGEL